MIKVKAILKRTGEICYVDIFRTSKPMKGSIVINVKDLENRFKSVRYEKDGIVRSWNENGYPNYIFIETLYQFNMYWDVIWFDIESFNKLDDSEKERYDLIYSSIKKNIRNNKLNELGII